MSSTFDYQVPKTPWYRKPILVIPAAILAIIIIGSIISALSGNGGDDSSTALTDPSVSTTADSDTLTPEETKEASSEPPAAKQTGKLPLTDGDWRLDDIRLKDDGLGDFGGNARITYIGDDTNGGNNSFTVTIFVGGKEVATADGFAANVIAGDTASVGLISTDKYVKGPYTYDFQGGF